MDQINNVRSLAITYIYGREGNLPKLSLVVMPTFGISYVTKRANCHQAPVSEFVMAHFDDAAKEFVPKLPSFA